METKAKPPASIRHVGHLEELLSEPTEALVEAFDRLEGDLLLLGAGGKMGPTLARMAVRASEAAGFKRLVIAASRFTKEETRAELHAHGVETVRCDLLDRKQLQHLPDVPNVVFMTGMKFGSTGQEASTWAMNSHLPALVCEKFSKSRIVAFSTGNVYGLSPVHLGGSLETDTPRPVGEYAMSCIGRERIFEYFSRTLNIPMVLLRLNYATEMRYGVLVDVARQVFAGEPVDVSMGNLNAIWQGDANAAALLALDHVVSPPRVVNLAGPELLSVRRVAEEFGQLFKKPVTIRGQESPDALLSNGQLGHRLFGYPRIGAQQMIHWIADWVARGGVSLGKPTHFEVRDGKF